MSPQMIPNATNSHPGGITSSPTVALNVATTGNSLTVPLNMMTAPAGTKPLELSNEPNDVSSPRINQSNRSNRKTGN